MRRRGDNGNITVGNKFGEVGDGGEVISVWIGVGVENFRSLGF